MGSGLSDRGAAPNSDFEVVPKHIVGGVYKATNALFFMPDGSQRRIAEPDPDGDYLRHIADDPPAAFDTPIITDLD